MEFRRGSLVKIVMGCPPSQQSMATSANPPSVGAQFHPRRTARSGHIRLEPPPPSPVNILPTLTLGVTTEGYKITGPASFCRTPKNLPSGLFSFRSRSSEWSNDDLLEEDQPYFETVSKSVGNRSGFTNFGRLNWSVRRLERNLQKQFIKSCREIEPISIDRTITLICFSKMIQFFENVPISIGRTITSICSRIESILRDRQSPLGSCRKVNPI